MGVKSVAKYIPISPRKCRRIIDMIRGKETGSALLQLKFSPTRSARMIYKVLKSAVSNAENNHNMSVDELYVHRAYVDEGPTMKRFQAGPRGRAMRIRERSSHITVEVEQKGVEK
ncbi:MAG: 50S ribosomal protein L22 [Candidatus Atribacteria bacterium]|nr:50S ribosomal protein L22 [Candidatus Atribacteria bacterium]